MADDWRFDAGRLLPRAATEYPPGAAEFVTAVYRASLRPEEGKVHPANYVLVPPDARVLLLVEFDEVDLDASRGRLRKIGGTVSSGDTCMLAVGGEPPMLVGICSKQSAEIIFPTLSRPSPLFVGVIGRGAIRVMHAGQVLIYSIDEYLDPSPTAADFMMCVPPAVVEGLLALLEQKVAHFAAKFGGTHERIEDPTRTVLGQVLGYLGALAQALGRLGTGGAVLILPNPEIPLGTICHKYHGLTVPNPDAVEAWSGVLLEALALSVLTMRPEPEEALATSAYMRHARDARRYAEDEIRQTAGLACADGAAIIDWSFTPRALGAKFIVSKPEDLPDDVRKYLHDGEKGLRHTSMAHAVNNVRGSFGIVASADGDCTLFSHWPNTLKVLAFVASG